MLKVALLSTLDAVFLGYIIKEFGENGIDISCVICDSKQATSKDLAIHQERTNGRLPGISLFDPSISCYNIPYYLFDNHSSSEVVKFVQNEKIDLLVNAGTPRILRTNILNAPSIGVLNCHPGILPKYRGASCVEWAILNDEQVGNTTHFMTEGIDEGPIIQSEGLTFERGSTYVDIRVAVYQHSFLMLARAIKLIQENNLHPSNMPLQSTGQYFRPMPNEIFLQVKQKVSDSKYAFQLQ
jgi:methionyl-tRNA formyltransferase